MNKMMEMYSPSHKKRVMAEVVEGYAQNGKGGSPRLALKGLFEGKKTLPKKVNAETFEKYGFNAEETIAAFHAEQVGEPLPESPLEDAPSTVPSPIEPTNANFSADERKYQAVDVPLGMVCVLCENDKPATHRIVENGMPFFLCEKHWFNYTMGAPNIDVDFSAEDSPSPSGPSEEPEPAEATGSEPSNENFSADVVTFEARYNKNGTIVLSDNDWWDTLFLDNGNYLHWIPAGSREGDSDVGVWVELREKKGLKNNFTSFNIMETHTQPEGEKVRIIQETLDKERKNQAKRKGGSKHLPKKSFNTESLVEEPDWIPDGDGRALGQQNFGINMSPLHAESFNAEYPKSVSCAWCNREFNPNRDKHFEYNGEFMHYECAKEVFDVTAWEDVAVTPSAKAESQKSMILEACGICDKEFNAETLNADGYCGSCCDTRLAEFEEYQYNAETDDEPYYCMDCDDRQRLPVEEMCPKCLTEGQFYCWECCSRNEGDAHFSAESNEVSKNAQIAIGLTALGVGLALWKSDSIMNIIDKIKKIGE